MSEIARRFLREPIFFLGSLEVTAVALAAEGVIPNVVALVTVAIVTGLQRQLVTPNAKVSRRKR